MWELDCEEGWVPKNWCFWTVVLEKTLESPLDCKEIQPVHSKGDQPWVFFGRTDAKAETPVLWPPHAKSWLIGKDSDAGTDWGQEEKGMTEDEIAGWHHWLDGHEFEWTLGDGDGHGGLACSDSWGHKESDTAEGLNWTELKEKGNPSLPFWVKSHRTNSIPHSNQNINKPIYWYFLNCYGETHLSENLMNTMHDTFTAPNLHLHIVQVSNSRSQGLLKLSLSWSWESLLQGEHAPIQTDKHANVIIKNKVNGKISERVLFRLWYCREISLMRYASKKRKGSLEFCMASKILLDQTWIRLLWALFLGRLLTFASVCYCWVQFW